MLDIRMARCYSHWCQMLRPTLHGEPALVSTNQSRSTSNPAASKTLELLTHKFQIKFGLMPVGCQQNLGNVTHSHFFLNPMFFNGRYDR